jgi:hypothetical protein
MEGAKGVQVLGVLSALPLLTLITLLRNNNTIKQAGSFFAAMLVYPYPLGN